jgi:soluble lytic murein transglycosylase-like protein
MYRLRGLGTIQDDISAAASRYGIPAWLALAVAKRESGFDPNARGAAGEIGVFQLMPGTAADLGVNPSDPAQNIDGGLRYLQQMYQRFGDWRTALEAYNAGPGRVSSGNIPSSSVAYADSILGASDFGPDGSIPGPTGDSWTGGNGEVAGLSGGALAVLGLIVVGGLWAVMD